MREPTVASAATARFEALAFRVVPLAIFATLSAVCLVAGPSWSVAAAPWPWLISLVVVGLPHGAADLALTRCICRGAAAVVALFACYVAVMAVAGGAFAVAPVPVLLAFVALSGWHFGAAHADTQSEQPARRPGTLGLAAIARGGAVVGIPLAARPEASAAVAGSVTMLAGASADFAPAAVRATGMVLVALAVVALILEAWRTRRDRGGPGRVGATVVDLAAIGLLEATADPLFAVGCYFLVWHAWRQMRPLAVALGCGPIAGSRRLASALLRIHARALPLLLPTWAALAAAWWWLPAGRLAHDPRGLAILSLAVYVVVTPSHDLLMEWWHRRLARVSGPSPPVAARSGGRGGAAAG